MQNYVDSCDNAVIMILPVGAEGGARRRTGSPGASTWKPPPPAPRPSCMRSRYPRSRGLTRRTWTRNWKSQRKIRRRRRTRRDERPGMASQPVVVEAQTLGEEAAGSSSSGLHEPPRPVPLPSSFAPPPGPPPHLLLPPPRHPPPLRLRPCRSRSSRCGSCGRKWRRILRTRPCGARRRRRVDDDGGASSCGGSPSSS